jgi:hypothetical protein
MSRSALRDDDPPPGITRWLISCDESGIHGARFYGFGTLWMRWQRRGDFHQVMSDIRKNHPEHLHSEFKWQYVKRQTLPAYRDLVEFFFKRAWLSFHCLVVEKSVVDKALHQGSYDLARQKHLTMLLTRKARQCVRAHPGREQTFRVWIDPIASSYDKADEVVEIISNHVITKLCGREFPVEAVSTRDSKTTPSIQMCDVLLGAVMDGWQGESSTEAKTQLETFIASHLGWTDLHADTHPSERKLNVWVFYDPTRGPRRASTREVVLKYPLPKTRSPDTRAMLK